MTVVREVPLGEISLELFSAHEGDTTLEWDQSPASIRRGALSHHGASERRTPQRNDIQRTLKEAGMRSEE